MHYGSGQSAELAGVAEWWQGLVADARTDQERLRAFVAAARRMNEVARELPAYRRRAAELRRAIDALPSPLEARVKLAGVLAAIEAKQHELERSAAGVLASIRDFLAKSHDAAQAAGPGGLGVLPAIAGVPAWLLLVGAGAVAAFLSGVIIKWLLGAESHAAQIELGERLVGEIRAGRLTPAEAEKMLLATQPPAGMLEQLTKLAPFLVIGAAALILPELLPKGRKR